MFPDPSRLNEAEQTIDQALETCRPACVTTSFQSDGMVLIHLLTRRLPEIPVLFVDTGYHFAETYKFRNRMAREFDLNLINLYPKQTVAQQESQFGILHQFNSDLCCQMRKVEPLWNGLRPYDIWFSALRREQSPTRAHLKLSADFALPGNKTLLKVSPLASWTSLDIEAYSKQYRIPKLPLYAQGYQSIGCEPCTQVPMIAGDPRSGRWAGAKLECGIHIAAR